MAHLQKTAQGWFTSKSATRGTLKKIPGFEQWFYTGPTLHFGHVSKPKKG